MSLDTFELETEKISNKEEHEIKDSVKNLEKDVIKNIENKNNDIEDIEDIETSWININMQKGSWTLKFEFKFYISAREYDRKEFEFKTKFFQANNWNIHIKVWEKETHIYENKEKFKEKWYSDILEDIQSLQGTQMKEINQYTIKNREETKKKIDKKNKVYAGIIYNSFLDKKNIKPISKEWEHILIPFSRKWKNGKLTEGELTVRNKNERRDKILLRWKERSINNQEEQTGEDNSILIKFCESCRKQIPKDIRKNISEKQQYTLFYPKFAQAFSKL